MRQHHGASVEADSLDDTRIFLCVIRAEIALRQTLERRLGPNKKVGNGVYKPQQRPDNERADNTHLTTLSTFYV
jgi:hypothetical protein